MCWCLATDEMSQIGLMVTRQQQLTLVQQTENQNREVDLKACRVTIDNWHGQRSRVGNRQKDQIQTEKM